MRYVRNEYPRPQFRREKWENLNGEWEFAFDDKNEGDVKEYYNGKVTLPLKINVPFAYQSKASGIGELVHHETVWYKRSFVVDKTDKNTLLCFNGCDYETDVWVNGYHVIKHVGGYTSFKKDITPFLKKGENILVVKCVDPLGLTMPRGKQSRKFERHGCWYIPTTGIWQSVWLENFKGDYIDEYSLLSDIDRGVIYGDVRTMYNIADTLKIKASFGGETVAEESVALDEQRKDFTVDLKNKELRLWSPENPNLYSVDFALYKDSELLDLCHTRIGLKKISIENGKVCLNGSPYYQKLILDQGYWEETDLTPPSAQALYDDIVISKKMGFNGARKHQKIEDPYFNYYAEELGFLTWCEMPSAYGYSDAMARNVMREWSEIVLQQKSFTSIVFYVPFNESWGVDAIKQDKRIQNLATSAYYLTKALDQTRLVSTNDGWENLDNTDIVSVHDYAYDDSEFKKKYIDGDWNTLAPVGRAEFVDGAKYRGQPLLFTEFGGVAMSIDAKGENWGYGESSKSAEEFYPRIEKLVKGILKCPFQGYCYTQLTDLQQEVNGLLDYSHKPKFDVDKIHAIFALNKEE